MTRLLARSPRGGGAVQSESGRRRLQGTRSVFLFFFFEEKVWLGKVPKVIKKQKERLCLGVLEENKFFFFGLRSQDGEAFEHA